MRLDKRPQVEQPKAQFAQFILPLVAE